MTQIAPFSLLSAADGGAHQADSAAPLAGDLGKPGSPQERWLYLLTGASEGDQSGWEGANIYPLPACSARWQGPSRIKKLAGRGCGGCMQVCPLDLTFFYPSSFPPSRGASPFSFSSPSAHQSHPQGLRGRGHSYKGGVLKCRGRCSVHCTPP